MGVSDGGGGGRSIGASSALIAAAAAKAALMHDGWQEAGEHSCRRMVGGSPVFNEQGEWVEVDTLSGEVRRHYAGHPGGAATQALGDKARAVLEKWREEIAELFLRWRDLPSPQTPAAVLDSAVAEISAEPELPYSVHGSIGGVNGRLAGDLVRLSSRTGELNGGYAEAFADYCVSDLPEVFKGQVAVLATMAMACRAQGEVWARAASDLADFEVKALEAMRESGPRGAAGGIVLALTLVAAVGTALAAVPTFGTSVALFGTAAGAATAAAGVVSARQGTIETADLPLGAGHPDQVLANLRQALNAIDAEIQAQEGDIRVLLEGASSYLDDGKARIGVVDPDDHRRGLSTHQLLTVDPVTIAKITELWLPSIAGDLRHAERRLDVRVDEGFSRSTSIGMSPTGAWPEFRSVQSRASALLLRNATVLEEGALALKDAAAIVGLTDDGVSQRLRRVERCVEKHNINDSAVVLGML